MWYYLIVLAAVVLIGASVYLLRLRRDDWLRFADRHDLEVVADNDLGAPTLRGTMRGREVLLRSEPVSSDTGALGVEVLTVRVRLSHDLPRGLEVTAKSMVSGLEPARENEIVDFDDDFAAAARVSADDEQDAQAYLNGERRRAIIDAFAAADTPDVAVVASDPALDAAAVFARWREASSDLEHLEARMAVLLRCAERLDGA